MIVVDRVNGPYMSHYVRLANHGEPILSWHTQRYSDFNTGARLITRGFIEDPIPVVIRRGYIDAYLIRDVKYKVPLERMQLWRNVESFYTGKRLKYDF